MGYVLKAVVAAGLGIPLVGSSAPTEFSASLLSALDPTRLAEAICGPRRNGAAATYALAMASTLSEPTGLAAPIPLFDDLTKSTFPLTTSNAEARQYFSQGLLMSYGFNHAGAVRSFRAAQRLDPECAMCWWGEAVALGPNINAPMDDRDRQAALSAMDRAMALRNKASPMERALIEAVATRYSRDPGADRSALDVAYADAMLGAARQFAKNDDVAVLAAEAAMDTTPWNYWQPDKKTPIGRTGEAIRLVEAVLARSPDHPQAAHLYIHLLEASDPQRAEAAADRLSRPVAPSAAHLVHMPGHIYQLRGRYRDSIRVNIAAARSDEAFIQSANDRSLVRFGYYPHNVHFIVASAQMAGDMDTAIREAQRLRTILDPETSARIAWIQAIDAAPYFAMAQFAAPDAVLAMPAPDPRLPYAVAMRHYARATAYAVRQDRAGFDREIAAMEKLAASNAFADMVAQGMPAPDLLALAKTVARGRFATAQKQYAKAAEYYRQALTLESRIPYQEPPYWYYPVRQSLAAVLYLDGQYAEAGREFRAALSQTPRNGWVLYGLALAEEAQGHRAEAAAARQAFSNSWAGDRNWLRMDRL